jgi:hypothetical protein
LIYYHTDQRFELFNIPNDIGESTNLADIEIETKKQLSIELGEYLRLVNAQMPTLKKTGEKVPYPDEVLDL